MSTFIMVMGIIILFTSKDTALGLMLFSIGLIYKSMERK